MKTHARAVVIGPPGVDAYLAGLPDWQREICERREMIRATDPRVSDPHGVINQGHGNATARANLMREVQTAGVEAERLVFAGKVPYAAHLARYAIVDLALDTFPYTSHTILSDALWCGCPTVALCGETFPVTRSPKPNSPVCPDCKKIFESMKA